MELRTIINLKTSEIKIDYHNPVMFIGSCFASEIGEQMEKGLMPVMINPSGTVYNPVSVINTIESIVQNRKYELKDLYFYKDTYLSLYHYTNFSSGDPLYVLEKINKKTAEAVNILSRATFLFISFGTSRVYRLKETGTIVSNCHKMPQEYFKQELLTVEEIADIWIKMLNNLQSVYPQLKVVFTISPVRHLKDGAHGNQVSKSILFLAVERLLNHPVVHGYFPAYELMMDDLRDYRFYENDMLHPSELAIEYIWGAFSEVYFDKETSDLWREVRNITKASSHRILNKSSAGTRVFSKKILSQINVIQKNAPYIDFSELINYFTELAGES